MNLVGKLLLLGSAALVGCTNLVDPVDRGYDNSSPYISREIRKYGIPSFPSLFGYSEREFGIDVDYALSCEDSFYDICRKSKKGNFTCFMNYGYPSWGAVWLEKDRLVRVLNSDYNSDVADWNVDERCGDIITMTFWNSEVLLHTGGVYINNKINGESFSKYTIMFDGKSTYNSINDLPEERIAELFDTFTSWFERDLAFAQEQCKNLGLDVNPKKLDSLFKIR